jgi:alpha-galactosidase
MKYVLSALPLAGALLAFGCSGGSTDGQKGTGGSTSTQGTATGGTIATGGNKGSGGAASTGGMMATGGTTAGGSTATGGASPSGGKTGTTGGGGAGGQSSAGGTTSTAGNDGSAAGGSAGTATGGSSGTGGVAAGGGGGTHTGGSTGAGGSGTGGSTILAATPPMGWNSWNTFGCDNLNETVIKGTADAMVSSGMAAVGYQFVNLDDCWMNGRDASGNIQWNMSKFPSGSGIVDYVHGKGLKIGLYSTPNTSTCSAVFGTKSKTVVVGSLGHETQDAKTFASWKIDYLKYDQCTGPVSGFAVMRDALRASGRDIVYSINPGCFPPSTCTIDVKTIANLWRIGFDINNSWSSMVGMIDQNKDTSKLAGPGHWNDPDMLEVGRGMSAEEDRSHFAMWAIMAAPLLAGNDITKMSATTTAILTNPDIIAVDQDPLGAQGTVVATPATNLEVWSKPMSGTNTRAVALFNRTGAATSMTVQWTTIGIPAGAATVRDLWNQKDLGSFTGSYTATTVPSHGVVVLKVVSAP